MPEMADYENEEEWMAACVPMRKGEGDDQDTAVAACLSMWRKREDGSGGMKVGARHSSGDVAALQAIHDAAIQLGAMCPQAEIMQIPVIADKSMDDTLISFGDAVKALGNGKIGGYLIRFATPEDPDLIGEFFTKDTDYGGLDGSIPPNGTVYYQHGLDPKMKHRRFGIADHRVDEFGVWAEVQLGMRDKYEKFLYQLAEQGKLAWSSGTAPHLVEREPQGKAVFIKSWPLGLDDTLTPTPAEFRNSVVPLKSLYQQPTGDAEAAGKAARSKGARDRAVNRRAQQNLALQLLARLEEF